MMAPSAEDLLRVWEEQRQADPVRRAVGVLATAVPELGWDGWMSAPIGSRDGALLDLQERLFGGDLHTTATCPDCRERVESTFHTSDVRAGASAPAGAAPSL